MVGSVVITRLLLAAGANPNAVNFEKRTPIHYALAFGHAEVAGLLWKAGTDMTFPDKNGVRYSWNLDSILCLTVSIHYQMNRPIDLVENPGAISPEVSALFNCAIIPRSCIINRSIMIIRMLCDT